MNSPLTYFWNKRRDNEKLFEFQQGVVMQEQQVDANSPSDPIEAVRIAERDRMLLGSQTLEQYLVTHPEWHAFIPALASVNRTTKHMSRHDAQVMWLDFQILHCMEEMCMPPDVFEQGGLEFLQGMEIYEGPLISDGFEGWKGRIVTENKKTISTEFKKGK